MRGALADFTDESRAAMAARVASQLPDVAASHIHITAAAASVHITLDIIVDDDAAGDRVAISLADAFVSPGALTAFLGGDTEVERIETRPLVLEKLLALPSPPPLAPPSPSPPFSPPPRSPDGPSDTWRIMSGVLGGLGGSIMGVAIAIGCVTLRRAEVRAEKQRMHAEKVQVQMATPGSKAQAV